MNFNGIKDALTVPNGISVLGAAYVARGLHEGLDTPEGAWHVFEGRMLDLVDGLAARVLHQASDFGAILDPTLDKGGVAGIVVEEWQKDIIPKPLALAIGAQQAANIALTGAAKKGHPEVELRPTREGKRGMFFQNFTMGFFSLERVFSQAHPDTTLKNETVKKFFDHDHPVLARMSGVTAYACAAAGLTYGAIASKQYYDRV
jgi:phosphatidylglycerophosphate synthase